MTTTWNPSDKGTNTTLSDTNHAATIPGSIFAASGARGTTSHASGKWYIEYPAVQTGSGNGGFVGFTVAATDLNSGFVTNAVGLTGNGDIQPTASGATGSGGDPRGKNVSFAIDIDNHKYWFREDGGSWFGQGALAGDPVAGTNGVPFSDTTLFPYCNFAQFGGATPWTTTINAGDRTFVYAIPTGFVAWDAPPPPATYSRAMVIH